MRNILIVAILAITGCGNLVTVDKSTASSKGRKLPICHCDDEGECKTLNLPVKAARSHLRRHSNDESGACETYSVNVVICLCSIRDGHNGPQEICVTRGVPADLLDIYIDDRGATLGPCKEDGELQVGEILPVDPRDLIVVGPR